MKKFTLYQYRKKEAIKVKEMNFKNHDIEIRIVNDDALLQVQYVLNIFRNKKSLQK